MKDTRKGTGKRQDSREEQRGAEQKKGYESLRLQATDEGNLNSELVLCSRRG